MMWNDLVRATLSLLLALLSALTPLLGLWIHRRFTAAQIGTVNQLAMVAVRAVEQMTGTEQLTDEQRFRSAMLFLDQLAGHAHITLTDTEMQPFIEGAVHLLHHGEMGGLITGSVQALEPFPPSSLSPPPDLTATVDAAVAAALGKVVWHPEVPVALTPAT